MYSYFEHPNNVCMTYFQHMRLRNVLSLGKGCICALIHAFIPSILLRQPQISIIILS